jgi:hypothetical protein
MLEKILSCLAIEAAYIGVKTLVICGSYTDDINCPEWTRPTKEEEKSFSTFLALPFPLDFIYATYKPSKRAYKLIQNFFNPSSNFKKEAKEFIYSL